MVHVHYVLSVVDLENFVGGGGGANIFWLLAGRLVIGNDCGSHSCSVARPTQCRARTNGMLF